MAEQAKAQLERELEQQRLKDEAEKSRAAKKEVQADIALGRASPLTFLVGPDGKPIHSRIQSEVDGIIGEIVRSSPELSPVGVRTSECSGSPTMLLDSPRIRSPRQ